MGEIILVRHGQTEWSATGRHTSYTDPPLTSAGERQATALRPALAGLHVSTVLCSPRRRARDTARLAGLAITATDEDLAEWNYGRYEGLTSVEIRTERPDWSLWRDGCPDGESPAEIGVRIDRVLSRIRPLTDAGSVLVIGHGHSLRVLTARYLGLLVPAGALFALATATLCTLGQEHDQPAMLSWNVAV